MSGGDVLQKFQQLADATMARPQVFVTNIQELAPMDQQWIHDQLWKFLKLTDELGKADGQ